jgi:predicted TIM-barrel fold metal-dependent hydrolase
MIAAAPGPAHEGPNGMVDYLCNAFLRDRQVLWERSIAAQSIPLKVREGATDSFCSADDMVIRMDELGLATIVLPVVRHCGSAADDPSAAVEFEDVATTAVELESIVGAHPGRFAGLWCIDPTNGAEGVRRAEAALGDPSLVGLYLHTHSFDRPFDHADYYPYYDLAGRSGVPVVMQAGTSGGRLPSECGKPIGIDRPAIYFEDTTFVLSHTGWPWVDETVAMALKFANVYLGTGSWPPARWSSTMVDLLRRAGRLDRLGLDDDILKALLGGNARSVFTRLR